MMTELTHILFPIQVFWSADDAEYVAIVHGMPGASALGKTRSEAVKELEIAMGDGVDADLMKFANRSLEKSRG